MSDFRPHRKRWRLLKWFIVFALGLSLSLLSSFQVSVFQASALPSRVLPALMTSTKANESMTLAQLSAAERLGRQLYSEGQFSAAIAQWQAVADAYGKQQNFLAQASALSHLSLSHQGLGQWEKAQTTIRQSLGLVSAQGPLNQVLENRAVVLVKARALMTQGRLQLALGKTERALESWQQAAEAYETGDDEIGMNRARINQAQALRELGFYRQALEQLLAVTESMETQPASMLKAIALRRLGEAFRLSGQLTAAQTALNESLSIARRQGEPSEISATLLSLGHTAQSLGDLEQAKELYASAFDSLSGPSADLSSSQRDFAVQRVPIELAQLDLAITMGDTMTATTLWPSIQQQFVDLPDSRNTLYQRVHWAISLIRLLKSPAVNSVEGLKDVPTAEFSALALPSLPTIDQQLREVTVRSRRLDDRRVEAYALGTLGQLHEFNHQWESAKQLTERSLMISREEKATDMLYQWQWQLGRLWKNKNNPAQSTERALEAYAQAVETLSTLRGDLSSTDGSTQFSFKENVEPIYRQLASLLLQTNPEASNYQKNLVQAQNVIESLRLAELDNYFQEACVDVAEIDINQADNHAAIVYTLVLEDRLSVLLHLPNQPIEHVSMAVSAQQVSEVTTQLRRQLVTRSRRQYVESAEQVYDWLIAPVRPTLDRSEVDTLVFVLDGPLQNVPMSTLYDGERFLIEDYSVALTPGLTLLNPQPWDSSRLSALIAGVTESRQGLSSLPYVASEVEKIAANIDRHTVLLDQDFTQASLSNKLRSKLYPIVHVATHGQFGSTAEETFLLAWDSLINVRDVSQMLQANLGGRGSIELLVLSACETASGDQRAALGLSGVAIKAGARSTVGSLWSVNDEVTSRFIGYFYEQLTQPGVSRAAALRSAQLRLIHDPRYRHPIYWAPYILLGSWL